MVAYPEISNIPGGGLIVAIDGPSGAGKSTVCRELAVKFAAKYLDTGALYRVATLYVLRNGIDPQDSYAVVEATKNLPLQVQDDPTKKEVILAGEDITLDIRSAEVNHHVSAVSAIPAVRTNLVALQRSLAQKAHRCILDGRDIGTNVLVDAPIKIFLTASAEVRARRRYDQERASGMDSDYDQVFADVVRRDELDSSRAVSPLRPADDAVIVDTSDKSLDQVIEELTVLIEGSAEQINDGKGGARYE